jgi:hypothetical protein
MLRRSYKHSLYASLVFLFIALFYSSATLHAADQDYYPYQSGDHFVYDLYWSRIKVGEAVLSFFIDKVPGEINGINTDALRMSFSVRTTGFANRIYRVDNLLETWLDPVDWRPLYHTKRQREGRRERDIELFFDWDAGTVVYVNAGNAQAPVEIPSQTQDPLSLLGMVARKPFVPGALFEIPATDGRRATTMKAEVVEQLSVQIPLGVFNSFKLDVATDDLRGVFSKSPDATIMVWFSNDAHRVFLRMESEVVISSFYGELASFESHAIDRIEILPAYEGDKPAFRSRRGRR